MTILFLFTSCTVYIDKIEPKIPTVEYTKVNLELLPGFWEQHTIYPIYRCATEDRDKRTSWIRQSTYLTIGDTRNFYTISRDTLRHGTLELTDKKIVFRYRDSVETTYFIQHFGDSQMRLQSETSSFVYVFEELCDLKHDNHKEKYSRTKIASNLKL